MKIKNKMPLRKIQLSVSEYEHVLFPVVSAIIDFCMIHIEIRALEVETKGYNNPHFERIEEIEAHLAECLEALAKTRLFDCA